MTDDDEDDIAPLPPGTHNYMTPHGYAVLAEELRFLLREERPKITEIVSWAAGNGDRSENGDYIYNKKKLREIDRRTIEERGIPGIVVSTDDRDTAAHLRVDDPAGVQTVLADLAARIAGDGA